MRNYFVTTLIAVLISPLAAMGASNLWEYFNGDLPSIDERAVLYKSSGFTDVYVGSSEQNNSLLNYLNRGRNFGSLARPSSTVEGTSTAGWTDDGSIVRLNTASDFVGIGTTNATEKLTIQGGNQYLSGILNVAGGTFNFSNGTGTTTLSVSNSGFLGISSSSPYVKLGVSGSGVFDDHVLTSYYTGTSTATSTLAGGFNVTSGCIARNGTCLSTTVDLAANYSWTGVHNFTGSQSIGTASTTAGNSLSVSGLASTTNLTTSNSCNGCISGNGNGYQILTQTQAHDGGTPSQNDLTMSCPSGKIVMSGGWNATGVSVSFGAVESYPTSTTTWKFLTTSGNGDTSNVDFYIICVRP